jgi:predicted RecA/RadA family phage recombinase
MAKATYKRGDLRTILYTAGADIGVDDIVVLGTVADKKARVGVARLNIANGATGIVAISGVFEFPKISGAVIKAGECVNWDAESAAVDDNAATTAAGDVAQFGAAMADAGNGTTVLDIDISEPGVYDAA